MNNKVMVDKKKFLEYTYKFTTPNKGIVDKTLPFDEQLRQLGFVMSKDELNETNKK